MRNHTEHVWRDEALANNKATNAQDLRNQDGYSFTAVIASPGSTAIGTVSLEASNNPYNNNVGSNYDANPNAVWVTILGSSYTFDFTDPLKDTQFLWNVSAAYYSAVRVKVTLSAGAGTSNIWITSKGPQS